MNFILKQYDTELLKFSATMDTSDPEIQILWRNENALSLMPLDLDLSDGGLSRWLRRRTIPKNRAYVHDLLAKQGLSTNRPMHIIQLCKGLSLNDSYWVVTEDDTCTYDAVNLYDNKFNRTLAHLAFSGIHSGEISSLTIHSSPEFTTNGMLPKCWRREKGVISLWKGGTSGASNTGYEPYSEFYAAQIAKAMNINAIDYTLAQWKGQLCSSCALFTDKNLSFIPVGHLVKSGGMEAVVRYYEKLGAEFLDALHDMFVLDAIICNTDRHFGNFGVLVDNQSNQIVAPAPLFDHGNSLFNLVGQSNWETDRALAQYIDTQFPCVYDDFIGTAKKVLTPAHRESLTKLLDFKFKKHSRYNLPSKRLRMIERQVQARAQELLK